jgi:hypothetical protein
MATQDEVIEIARNYLRDFPRFFQLERPKVGFTYHMGHANVTAAGLWVATLTGAVATPLTSSQYSVNERDGVLRIDQGVDLSNVETILVEGNYYQWLTPSDMLFYSDVAIQLHVHNLNTKLDTMAPAVVTVVGMGCIIQSLWGLLTEYSRDIDVIASESVHLPASQRFRMVQQLLTQWQGEYEKYAKALNIGLDRIEVLNLRRRSRTTNRLVPQYKEREVGDFGPMERLWIDIDEGTINLEEEDDALREDVFIDGEPPEGLTNGSYFPGYGAVYY